MSSNYVNHDAIGGFLELEIPVAANNNFPPMLSCGRNGLQWIIDHIKCNKIYMPYYICPVVPDTLGKAGIRIEFYHINEDLQPEQLPSLQDNEYFLYVNYFGIRDNVCMDLIDKLGDKLILDLTQAFFFTVPEDIKSFSSARKFFGVPDGACVTGVDTKNIVDLPYYNGTENSKHLLLRQDGKLADGYAEFVKHSASFSGIRQISNLSLNILRCVDLQNAASKRIENFSILHDYLDKINILADITPCAALCYPCLMKNGISIKKQLCENKIFVPTYWPKLDQGNELSVWEKDLIDNLVCFPIDQRYNAITMQYILQKMKEFI